jgi:hypothetical protein
MGYEMAHSNRIVGTLLKGLTLGNSVAESDNLLEIARVETSAFSDLINDRIDLVPGTKGSGKSALFRIFTEFLPDVLLSQRKIVVAHGVQAPGDPVFHAFSEQFSQLSEDDFVRFWCVYLVSLANEQFLKAPRFADLLSGSSASIDEFRRASAKAGIPDIRAKRSLREILAWSLNVLARLSPKLKYKPPEDAGEFELDLLGNVKELTAQEKGGEEQLPTYLNEIQESLERILVTRQATLWLMIDRLDEIFPRRSEVERRALRGLLRAMRYFSTPHVRVKVFLRDDMLDQMVNSSEGFTALTHVTARQADTLRWNQEQLQAMVVKRLFANKNLAQYLNVDVTKLEANAAYRAECFSLIFPRTVFKGSKQRATLGWIYDRCADGRGVVTPRDVIDLLIRAKQRQEDLCGNDPEGTAEWIIDSAALKYGFEELSKRKRQTYLQAEFPHLWMNLEKFTSGKTDYSDQTLQALLGKGWREITEDLVGVGFLAKRKSAANGNVYVVPRLYRHGMNLTQGKA